MKDSGADYSDQFTVIQSLRDRAATSTFHDEVIHTEENTIAAEPSLRNELNSQEHGSNRKAPNSQKMKKNMSEGKLTGIKLIPSNEHSDDYINDSFDDITQGKNGALGRASADPLLMLDDELA